jgi:hypothetical protein
LLIGICNIPQRVDSDLQPEEPFDTGIRMAGSPFSG